MGFDSALSAADIVTKVYSYYQPGVLWDADRLRDAFDATRSDEPPRLYCPSCGQHDAMRPRERQVKNGAGGITTEKFWRCVSCSAESKHPKILTHRGTIDARQTHSSTRDIDRQILLGIQAGKVMSAVERLPLEPRAWSFWAHTPLGTSDHRGTLFEYSARRCDAEGFRAEGLGEAAGALAVILRIVSDAARPSVMASTASELAKLAGVNRSQFSGRRWALLVAIVRSGLDALEGQMADAVYTAVGDRRQRALDHRNKIA